MGIHKYNRLKAASKQVQSEVLFDSAEQEQARRFSSTARRGKSTQFKIVLAEKEKTGMWLSEQMGHSISTVSRWMTNRSALWDACQSKKVQPMCGKFDLVARLSENSTRLLVILM